MDSLITGHRMTSDLACNWKVFWENYNECLHCPGIHPELCDMVPIYGKGMMAPPKCRAGHRSTRPRPPEARRRDLDHERRALRPGIPAT